MEFLIIFHSCNMTPPLWGKDVQQVCCCSRVSGVWMMDLCDGP